MAHDPRGDGEDRGDGERDAADRVRTAVARKAQRRGEAARREDRSIWFSLGMFGLIGWSVAIPSVAGAALGLWIDERWPSRVSWTLTLLLVGVVIGCANAWHWIKQESRDK